MAPGYWSVQVVWRVGKCSFWSATAGPCSGNWMARSCREMSPRPHGLVAETTEMALPTLRDGDKAEGHPSVQPSTIGYCEHCGCYRRRNGKWRQVRDELGFTVDVCDRHDEPSPDAPQ